MLFQMVLNVLDVNPVFFKLLYLYCFLLEDSKSLLPVIITSFSFFILLFPLRVLISFVLQFP